MADSSSMAKRMPPPGIDTTVPHSARFWDYLLGGRDNYPVDRAVGEQVLRIDPDLRDAARADRGFLMRAVRHLEAYSRRLLLMLVGVANRATDRIPRELSSNTRSLKDGPPRVPYYRLQQRRDHRVVRACSCDRHEFWR